MVREENSTPHNSIRRNDGKVMEAGFEKPDKRQLSLHERRGFKKQLRQMAESGGSMGDLLDERGQMEI